MKIELYPEDMLLDYVRQLLDGAETPKLKHTAHFSSFPQNLELSEEFAGHWQQLVEMTVKKFICDTFRLQQFLFDVDGHVMKFACTDDRFWQTIDLQFSHRSAQRMYEHMLRQTTGEVPLYPIALPGDALFISIAVADFTQYSFAWLEKNQANWIIWALFAAWQPAHGNKIPWLTCLRQPQMVPLPVRGYLYERSSAWFSCANHLLRLLASDRQAADNDFYELAAERSGSGLPLKFYAASQVSQVANAGRQLAEALKSAHQFWTGSGTVALDDDRFLQAMFNSSGLTQQIDDFAAVLRDFNETRGLEEQVNESVIFN